MEPEKPTELIDSLFINEVAITPSVPLHQMTSDVSAETDASIVDIFRALFPCASITGAPKIRTMQLIHALEAQPRGVYTGAIGVIAPDRHAQFNVAIRTAVIDQQQQTATYHDGSGVVCDSDATEEFDECRLKARVLTVRRPPFALLESLAFQPGEGLLLLQRHLQRLKDSAEYFAYPVDLADVQRHLTMATQPLQTPTKLRVELAADGAIRVETMPLSPSSTPQTRTIGLATEPVHSGNLFLYHKTTYRPMYDAARASRPDCDEVILWNERDELTEASVGNLVLELDGALCTPPVSSGLLPGTLRGHLVDEGMLSERVITLGDLECATRIWVINSVRGWRPHILNSEIAQLAHL